MRRILNPLVEAVFRVLFVYDCVGEENVPETGPAVVASNHPSYLDPILLSLQIRRPIHFMAWDALFRVPLLGALMRSFGAFPVDVRKGKGREAYARARDLVLSGEVVGVFPEGHRSQSGWMEPSLREGAARLAYETGAPLVPATIAGAYRAWPYFQALPRPARIRVRYHSAIDPAPFRLLPEAEALPALLAELRVRVDRSLLPGVKADLRMAAVYAGRGPKVRAHEWAPLLLVTAALVAAGASALWACLPPLLYGAYLAEDAGFARQSRGRKRLRTLSPILFLCLMLPVLGRALGVPPVVAKGALLAVMAGALFPYVYERGRLAVRFVQGLVFVLMMEAVAFVLWPEPAGPHLALPLFAGLFAAFHRTVFFRYATPMLIAYAAIAPVVLFSSPRVLFHALVSVLALGASVLASRLARRPPVGA